MRGLTLFLLFFTGLFTLGESFISCINTSKVKEFYWTKCGQTSCSLEQFCSEDKRCLYCSEDICRAQSIPVQCMWFCLKTIADTRIAERNDTLCDDTVLKAEAPHTFTLAVLVVSLSVNAIMVIAIGIYHLKHGINFRTKRACDGHVCDGHIPRQHIHVESGDRSQGMDRLLVSGRENSHQ